MIRDILAVKAAGADGVVVGLLTPSGDVDVARYDLVICMHTSRNWL